MTRTLILLRHAKSSWGDPNAKDHDRPLNDRGRRDAQRIGKWLADNDLIPEHAFCSSARRAEETLDGLGHKVPTFLMSDLYMASPQTILRVMSGAYDSRILIVAHNPGIGEAARMIVRQPPRHSRFADFPTAACLVADFEVETWENVKPGTGRVRAFVTPHDLPD